MRTIRTIFAFILAMVVYFGYSYFVRKTLWSITEDNNFWFTMLSFILDGGLASFLAFICVGFTTPKEHRFLLFGILLVCLYSLLIADFFPLKNDFWYILGCIVRLSFGAIGAFAAIALTSNQGKAKFLKAQGNSRYDISGFLTTAAFISVPFVYVIVFLSFFITVGACAWLLILVLQLPRIPVVLLIAIGFAPLIAGWAAVRGLIIVFKKEADGTTAIPIELAHSPALEQVVDTVCRKLATTKPDRIILHAEPTFFVTQSKIKTLDQQIVSGRILAIGAPLLYELDTPELKSILAHEFAHFTGNDTLYSKRILPVYKTISSVLEDLRVTGVNSTATALIYILLMIPRFCVLTFVNYFASIDNLLSRKREFRADFISAENFGTTSFKNALRKVMQFSTYFYKNIMDLEPEGQFFHYVHEHTKGAQAALESAFTEVVLKQEEEVFDSHPTFTARMENLPLIEVDNPDTPPMNKIIEELTPALDELSTKYSEFFNTIKGILKTNQET